MAPPRRRWLSRAARHGRGARRLHALGALVLLWTIASQAWAPDHDSGAAGAQLAAPAFVSAGFVKRAAPSLCALSVGLGLYLFGGDGKSQQTAAIVTTYFGAQTGMNLYMKSVLSAIVIDAEAGLKGIPIGFLLTAIQQFVALVAFCCFLVAGKFFSKGYQVKQLTSTQEYVAVLCFSVSFALNIGLNNFSLSLVAISINMLIRSCLPLSTAISQFLVGFVMDLGQISMKPMDWLLMLAGVGCAALATFANSKSSGNVGESASLTLGVIVATASIFSGALNMVLAGILGTKMKLNPLDQTCYMALPAGLVLLVPALVVSHPMSKWPDFPNMTDWQVLQEVMARNPSALVPVLFSGLLSFIYNVLQYTVVHKLSPTHATFAGNFNKAATVFLSLILGLEALPPGGYGQLFLLAVVGNIGAFTMYSVMKTKG